MYAGNFERLLESADYLDEPPCDVFDQVMHMVAQTCPALQRAMGKQSEGERKKGLAVS